MLAAPALQAEGEAFRGCVSACERERIQRTQSKVFLRRLLMDVISVITFTTLSPHRTEPAKAEAGGGGAADPVEDLSADWKSKLVIPERDTRAQTEVSHARA